MRAAKTLASLHICTGSPEPSSLDNVKTVPKFRADNNLCHHLCEQRRLCRVGIFEPSAHDNAIATKISCACSNGEFSASYAGRVTFAQPEPSQQYLNLMCWLK